MIAARRAVVRWAVRQLRREWRQQALVLALLTVAVATAIAGAAAAFNTAGMADDARFGTANRLLRLGGSDAKTLRADAVAVAAAFGTVDVIAHWSAPIPGSVERVAYRAREPRTAFSGPLLALRDGRYPRAGEVAVTDRVAETFGLGIGSRLAADGTDRVVVGRVENPSDLNDEFALVAPVEAATPASLTILMRSGPEALDSLMASGSVRSGNVEVGTRRSDDHAAAAVGVLGIAAVALLLVALVATASFVVVAQRRLRQLGMLAAIGATEKQVRLVLVANGAVVGLIAAGAGTAIGLAAWLAIEPRLETAASHRIDPFDLPWWLLATAAGLAIVAATGAAWWPARAAARVPIVLALSGRPPRPQPGRGSPLLAAALIALGVACLVRADQTSALLIAAGTLTLVPGVLLVSPFAIRALARTAGWFPVAIRLALRDLGRYQARSAAALAAISLSLGIPAAIVATAAAAQHGANDGNLSSRQLLIRPGDPDDPSAPCPGGVQARGAGPFESSNGPCPFAPVRTTAAHGQLEDRVQSIAADLDEATVIAFDVAFDPAVELERAAQPLVTLGTDAAALGLGDSGPGLVDVSLLYVATQPLLDHYDVDLRRVDPGADLLTVETGEVAYQGTSRRRERTTERVELAQSYTSLPGTFITPDALRRHGWSQARAGWLVEADNPVTGAQYEAARKQAASAGLLVEARDEREGLAALRSRATGAGLLAALAVLAMTVGLIRNEARSDLRALTATGATRSTRRTLTAATAAALALAGAALGIAGAYLALAAAGVHDIATPARVPLPHLAVIALGAPAAAALAGWLVGGREPDGLGRRLD